MKLSNQKGFAPIFLALGVLLILVLVGGGYLLLKPDSDKQGTLTTQNSAQEVSETDTSQLKPDSSKKDTLPTTTQKGTEESIKIDTSQWEIYKDNDKTDTSQWRVHNNNELGYSFKYPSYFNRFSDGYLSPSKECTDCITPEGIFPDGYLVDNPSNLPLSELAFKTSGWERDSTKIRQIKDDSNLTIILLIDNSPGSGPMRKAFILDKRHSRVIQILFQLDDVDLISQILSTFRFAQ